MAAVDVAAAHELDVPLSFADRHLARALRGHIYRRKLIFTAEKVKKKEKTRRTGKKKKPINVLSLNIPKGGEKRFTEWAMNNTKNLGKTRKTREKERDRRTKREREWKKSNEMIDLSKFT